MALSLHGKLGVRDMLLVACYSSILGRGLVYPELSLNVSQSLQFAVLQPYICLGLDPAPLPTNTKQQATMGPTTACKPLLPPN